jgi:hypothetical protein
MRVVDKLLNDDLEQTPASVEGVRGVQQIVLMVGSGRITLPITRHLHEMDL